MQQCDVVLLTVDVTGCGVYNTYVHPIHITSGSLNNTSTYNIAIIIFRIMSLVYMGWRILAASLTTV